MTEHFGKDSFLMIGRGFCKQQEPGSVRKGLGTYPIRKTAISKIGTRMNTTDGTEVVRHNKVVDYCNGSILHVELSAAPLPPLRRSGSRMQLVKTTKPKGSNS